jgi:AraC family transcriptional regulator
VAKPVLKEVSVRLQTDPAGVIDSPGPRNPVILIHVGPSVHIACERGGSTHRGTSVHGDVDIIPAGTPSRWELKEKDTALIVSISSDLLGRVAEESGVDPLQVEIINRFQIRDPQIEHIGWALKAEMEAEYRSGRAYFDGLSAALAACLVHRHSSVAREADQHSRGMSGHRLRQVLSYIEDNLGADLSLKDIAAAAGLSVSHCKTAFRMSVGLPVHQYVIQRRVERAKQLLAEGRLSTSQIALETGFAHQSHLAYHLRRLHGVSPKRVRDNHR